MPGIPSSEKEQLEKSLRYNLWASLIRFIVLNFVLTCVWFFGFGLGFDAIKAATGQQLKGTMTVTGVVQEDGLTLSVKDPNKGKHVVYSLTDLGVDPTGWSYGGRLNTYWSKDEDSGDYSIIAVIPEKEASRIQGLEDAILMTGYFSIIVIGLLIFLFDVENIPHGIFHFIGEWRSFVQKTRSTRCIQDIIQKRHLLPMEMSMLILFRGSLQLHS